MYLSGGLFDQGSDPALESIFRYVILRLNQDTSILPDTKILYDIQHLPQEKQLHCWKERFEITDFVSYMSSTYQDWAMVKNFKVTNFN